MSEEKNKGGRPVLATVSMCEYRKNGVECPKYQRNCRDCGWNPIVEYNRIEAIKKGKAEPFLRFNFKRLKAENQLNYRGHERDRKEGKE